MNAAIFTKIKPVFWIAYILLPILTGWFAYAPAENEYDPNKHELLESHFVDCGPEGLQSCEVPEIWRDERTGETYASSQFADHHRSESTRIATTFFAYGLIGCLFFAVDDVVTKRKKFIKAFQKALVVNAAITAFFYWIT